MNRVEALKKKMDQGKLLKGFFLTMADPAVSEIGGYAGYDYVWIDAEHAPLGRQEILRHIMAAQGSGCAAFVRVPGSDPSQMKAILDMGPDGVIFPFTNNPKIDPIGSTVGTKGVRISAISKELHNESIDCIEYSSVPEIFIAKALSPGQIISVKIQKQSEENQKPLAIIQLAKSQKSKIIGKSGVNIRLASMLTGYDFELHEIPDKEQQEDNRNEAIEQKVEKKLGLESLESLFKGKA